MTTETMCALCQETVRRKNPIVRANRAGRVENFCGSCVEAVDQGWCNFPGGEGKDFDPWMVLKNRDHRSGGWKAKPVSAEAVRS